MLADDLEISRGYLGDIESGRTYANYVLLNKIANACNVPFSFFNNNTRLGDLIKQAREEQQLSIEDLSNSTKISQKILEGIENNEFHADLNIDDWYRLANILKIPKKELLVHMINEPLYDELFSDLLADTPLDSTMDMTNSKEFVRIPILGTIHAGFPMFTPENIVDYVKVPANELTDQNYFYLQVVGDSMIDVHIFPGCIILVHQQDFLNDGQIGVFLVNNQEVMVRKYKRLDDKVILYAANSKFEPQVYNSKNVKILGRVIKAEFKYE